MTLFKSFDAAFPPPQPISGVTAVLGYIGADGETPHIWTPQEWNAAGGYTSGRGKYLMPIWVPNRSQDGRAQGQAAAKAARALGWFPGRAIVLDMETWVLPQLVAAFIEGAHDEGFREITYNSQSVLGRNPADLGYWVAAWDGSPTDPGGRVLGHQYADLPSVDLSVWESSALQWFGHGPRRVR